MAPAAPAPVPGKAAPKAKGNGPPGPGGRPGGLGADGLSPSVGAMRRGARPRRRGIAPAPSGGGGPGGGLGVGGTALFLILSPRGSRREDLGRRGPSPGAAVGRPRGPTRGSRSPEASGNPSPGGGPFFARGRLQWPGRKPGNPMARKGRRPGRWRGRLLPGGPLGPSGVIPRSSARGGAMVPSGRRPGTPRGGLSPGPTGLLR